MYITVTGHKNFESRKSHCVKPLVFRKKSLRIKKNASIGLIKKIIWGRSGGYEEAEPTTIFFCSLKAYIRIN